MASESKREIGDNLPPPHAKRSCLGDLDVNSANDRSDQQVWSSARAHPEESGGWLVLAPTERVLNAEYPTGDGVCSSSDHADQEVSRVVVRNPSKVKVLLNECYPAQVIVLSCLDRTDFRNMQLAGLSLRISRAVQRLHLIPIPCSNSSFLRPATQDHGIRSGFLTRVGWLPVTTCDNTTATMDEIKPCTGMVWFSKFNPGTTDDIDACREPHLDVTGKEVEGSSHNTCLECFLSAEQRMAFLEQRRVPRFRRTLCRKHTRKNTPQAQNKPCKCLEILRTEWRCWSCRKSTLRGLSGIAMMRKKALDERRYDNGDDQNGSEDHEHGDHVHGDHEHGGHDHDDHGHGGRDHDHGDHGHGGRDHDHGGHGHGGHDHGDHNHSVHEHGSHDHGDHEHGGHDHDHGDQGDHDHGGHGHQGVCGDDAQASDDGQDGQYDDDGQYDEYDEYDEDGEYDDDGISDEDDGERSDTNDSEDRDMRDDRIPTDGPHFCPMAGCNSWISDKEQEAAGEVLTICLACQTILLPSEEEEEEDEKEEDDDNGGAGESDFED